MDWFLSALWDAAVICLIVSAFAVALILVAIGVEDFLAARRRRRDDKCWAQIVRVREELTIDELHRAERVERVRVFKSTPEAVAEVRR